MSQPLSRTGRLPLPAFLHFPYSPDMRVVILGIGNILLGDEGVGVRAVEALRQQYHLPPTVEVLDGGTSSMTLLEELAELDVLIVLDAILAGKAPGTVIRLAAEAVPVFFRTKLSPHQISLADVLASLEFMGRLPKEVVVIGVQPLNMDLGLALTPTIAATLPELLSLTVQELAAHGVQLTPVAALS